MIELNEVSLERQGIAGQCEFCGGNCEVIVPADCFFIKGTDKSSFTIEATAFTVRCCGCGHMWPTGKTMKEAIELSLQKKEEGGGDDK